MGAAENVLKQWSIFVDGRGFAGNCEEFNAPKLDVKTEDFEGGGMDAAIEVEMGMEKLMCDFTLTKFDPKVIALWGIGVTRYVPIVARGSVQGLTGDPLPVIHTCRGIVKGLEPGGWGGKGKGTLKFTMNLRYYKLEVAGTVTHEIDIPNFVRIVDGVDILAKHRANLGLQ